MAEKITIIGAGPGGYVAAIRAAQRGAEVTVIEQDNVGGTCLNWGCIPSKIMITTAELLEKFRKAKDFGIALDGKAAPDMKALMSRKEKIIQDQAKGILGLFSQHKIQYVKGEGRVKAPGVASVWQENGEVLDVKWDKLILALGTAPVNVPYFPFDGDGVLSSNDALNLREVPESVVIFGGGVIGCEFAFILNALGSNVTVVEGLSRLLPLPSVDEDCSKVLQREMKKRKISVFVGKTVEDAEYTDDGKLEIRIGPSPFVKSTKREEAVIQAEKLLICIGRKPLTMNVGLDRVELATDIKGWIPVNERMETPAPGVYAIGDVLGPSKIMLAHVASAEGAVAAENATGGNRTMNYNAVPGAIFTMPEVANVGLTEVQAKEQGYNIRAESVLFRTIGKAHVIGEIDGQAKIVSDAESGKILGVHIIGPHATELIAEGTLAVQSGCTVRELAETIHAHPTLAEIMAEVSFKLMLDA